MPLALLAPQKADRSGGGSDGGKLQGRRGAGKGAEQGGIRVLEARDSGSRKVALSLPGEAILCPHQLRAPFLTLGCLSGDSGERRPENRGTPRSQALGKEDTKSSL